MVLNNRHVGVVIPIEDLMNSKLQIDNKTIKNVFNNSYFKNVHVLTYFICNIDFYSTIKYTEITKDFAEEIAKTDDENINCVLITDKNEAKNIIEIYSKKIQKEFEIRKKRRNFYEVVHLYAPSVVEGYLITKLKINTKFGISRVIIEMQDKINKYVKNYNSFFKNKNMDIFPNFTYKALKAINLTLEPAIMLRILNEHKFADFATFENTLEYLYEDVVRRNNIDYWDFSKKIQESLSYGDYLYFATFFKKKDGNLFTKIEGKYYSYYYDFYYRGYLYLIRP